MVPRCPGARRGGVLDGGRFDVSVPVGAELDDGGRGVPGVRRGGVLDGGGRGCPGARRRGPRPHWPRRPRCPSVRSSTMVPRCPGAGRGGVLDGSRFDVPVPVGAVLDGGGRGCPGARRRGARPHWPRRPRCPSARSSTMVPRCPGAGRGGVHDGGGRGCPGAGRGGVLDDGGRGCPGARRGAELDRTGRDVPGARRCGPRPRWPRVSRCRWPRVSRCRSGCGARSHWP